MINYYYKYLASHERYARFIGVNLGTNNDIQENELWSSEPWLITVGNNCQFVLGSRIFTHGGGRVLRTIEADYDSFGKVIIGNSVYLGANSLIMPGVTIGDGVLVAAGSVVTKSVPANVVVGGNPAKILCTINEYYEKNKKYNAHTKQMTKDEKRSFILSMDESLFIKKPHLKIKWVYCIYDDGAK